MNKVKTQFKELKKEHPYWSTWTCFTVAIKESKLDDDEIVDLFYKLVNKHDYEQTNELELLGYLIKLAK